MNEKKIYLEPTVQLIDLDSADILTTSCPLTDEIVGPPDKSNMDDSWT